MYEIESVFLNHALLYIAYLLKDLNHILLFYAAWFIFCYVILVPESTQYGNLCGNAWNMRVVLCSLALLSGRLLTHLTNITAAYHVLGLWRLSGARDGISAPCL